MSVYVDNMRAPYRGMIMCHMFADTTDELLDMANRIGVDTRWIQDAGTAREHFDIALSKRKIAVRLGAKEVGMLDIGKMIQCKRLAATA